MSHIVLASLAVITCAAAAGGIAGHAIVFAVRGACKRAVIGFGRHAMRQAALRDGITPALAARTGPYADLFTPAPRPSGPPPAWATTSDPSPADLTIFDRPPAPDWVRAARPGKTSGQVSDG